MPLSKLTKEIEQITRPRVERKETIEKRKKKDNIGKNEKASLKKFFIIIAEDLFMSLNIFIRI